MLNVWFTVNSIRALQKNIYIKNKTIFNSVYSFQIFKYVIFPTKLSTPVWCIRYITMFLDQSIHCRKPLKSRKPLFSFMFIIYQNINHEIVALSEHTKGLDMICHVWWRLCLQSKNHLAARGLWNFIKMISMQFIVNSTLAYGH